MDAAGPNTKFDLIHANEMQNGFHMVFTIDTVFNVTGN